jgi:hypothetical protein
MMYCDLCSNGADTLYECWFSVKWLDQPTGLNQLYRVCKNCSRLSIPYQKRGESMFTQEPNKTTIDERKPDMCSYLNLIEKTVDDYVKGNMMFTAYDVTKEVRKQATDRVYNDEVKKDVHKYFGQGMMAGYSRALAIIAGVNPQPWLYFPMGADPSKYTGTPIAHDTQPDDGNVISSIGSFANTAPTIDSKVYKLDTTDRLCIPNKFVRQLGVNTGWTLFVNQSGTALSISKTGNINFLAFYMVDKDDNVRLTASTLRKGGLNCSEFQIDGTLSEILIKSAN